MPTVTHGGSRCFIDTEETTCPHYATGVMTSCTGGPPTWSCTHRFTSRFFLIRIWAAIMTLLMRFTRRRSSDG